MPVLAFGCGLRYLGVEYLCYTSERRPTPQYSTEKTALTQFSANGAGPLSACVLLSKPAYRTALVNLITRGGRFKGTSPLGTCCIQCMDETVLSFVRLVQHRVVSGDVVARAEILGGGERENYT